MRLFALVVVGAIAGCSGRQHAASSGGPSHTEPRVGPSIAVLDLTQGLPEQPATNVLGLPGRGGTLEELLREADRIAGDKDVRGVLVRLGTANIPLARAGEVGSVLHGLGAKLPIYCHADDLSNTTLYLASVGCKRVWLSAAGTVDAVGIAAQMVYFHKLLADELGLDVDFLQVGKYKGAEEPFTRDGPSPEARASLESTLGDLRAAWLDGMRKGRPVIVEGAAEDGPYPPQAAKERGLIDDVGYFDEARDALKKASGAVRAEVRLGGAPSEGGDLGDVLHALLAGDSLGAAPVALVRALGAISTEGGGGIGGGGGIVERRLVRTLVRLAKDDDVKAVVLRIDSPGGSALASDLLWHALMDIRAKKPLVVSVGGMAASGGFYLASTGTSVFADEGSIVGSIGVVGGKVAIGRALEKIGVHAETIPAKTGDAHAGARAAAESVLQPWDDATRARLLETMTSIYDLFLARVAEGRKIPVEQVRASAEGRIFGGKEGKVRGLVDEIGGLKEVLACARSLAGLAADARFAVVDEPSNLLDALGGESPESQGGEGFAAVAVAAGLKAADDSRLEAGFRALSGVAPYAAPFVASLWPILASAGGLSGGGGRERVLCALPFALTVQ
jgi:protease IV